ncbi:MAG TPA: LD-carboxypeptidase [Bacteroidetes bacterium]|nr:LD-carboxypeptidase [Bacteroidota bacterium]
MKFPSALKAGDKVGILSTARKISVEQLQPALDALREWGLEPVLGQHLFAEDHQYAGTDGERRADLQMMIEDRTIRAILCARGGYGTLRIIDGVDLRPLRRNPKWIVGFSDVTTLTMACYNAGVASIHGPMAVSWNGKTGDVQSREYLRQMLFGKLPNYSCMPARTDLVRTGVGEGRLIGGNLSMLSQLLGTETDFDTRGCILFIEDLDEYLYHLDRMVVHLQRGGKFERLAGLIVGGFTDVHDNDTPFGKTVEEIIADATAGHAYPICFDFPVGHWPQNYPLLHGARVRLEVSHTRADLHFLEGGVE